MKEQNQAPGQGTDSAVYARMNRYLAGAFPKVGGFVNEDNVWALKEAARFQEIHNIIGGFFEIGIHQGRFFLALEHAARENEAGFAVDVFEDQKLNIDNSGYGNKRIFEDNLSRYAVNPSRVRIIDGDSTSLELKQMIAESKQAFRLISVDGGHTAQHACSDLRLAEAHAVNGAAVFLDDYFNPGFPGVTEGLMWYLQSGGLLTPVLALSGKMLLASLSWAERFREHFRETLQKDENYRVRMTRICGYDYVSARSLKKK